MKFRLLTLMILWSSLRYSVHANIVSLDTNKFTTESYAFDVANGKYCLDGELITPHNFQPNGKLVILVAPPRPTDMSYFGFFDVLVQDLAANGVAVFRFNNRNYKYKHICHDCLPMKEHASDVHAAFLALKKIDLFSKAEIGLLGHSEGGAVASIEAANNPGIKFCILLSTIGFPGDRLALEQAKNAINSDTTTTASYKEKGINLFENMINIVKREDDPQKRWQELVEFLNDKLAQDPELARPFPAGMAVGFYLRDMLKPRIVQYIQYDPERYVSKIQCPILAIYGNMDEKIDPDLSIENLRFLVEKYQLKSLNIIRLDSLDHSYQKVSEKKKVTFKTIKITTISQDVLQAINGWLKNNN